MAIWGRIVATYETWKHYGEMPVRALDKTEQDKRYEMLGAFYKGKWTENPYWQMPPYYRNARQVVQTTQAIIDCYEQLVWAGELPSPGKELSEDAMLAFPIETQTGGTEPDQGLLDAIYTNFDIWQWRMRMGQIPKTAAIYGDVLVVLVDETEDRGIVVPEIYNPWVVPPCDLELDGSDNIKALAIEYDVTIEASTAFGRDVKAETYRYRKEMTPEAFFYFKDGKPFAYPDRNGKPHPAVEPNPYGFVPAAWFRHELVVGSDRGVGAFEKTLRQQMGMNSTLSAALDYSEKNLGAPIGIKGSPIRPGQTVTSPGGIAYNAETTPADIEASQREAAERFHLMPLSANGEFVTIPFDIGQTTTLLDMLHDALVRESPESKYAQLIAEMTNPTSPGVKMTLRPIIAKTQRAERLHDAQMKKVVQMGISMMGMRLNNGDIPPEIVRARPDRYTVFKPYTLDSYGQGKLDFSVADRDPFPESKLERAQWLAIVDALESPWAKITAGMPKEEVEKEEAEKKKAAEEMTRAMSVAGAPAPGERADDNANDSASAQPPRTPARREGDGAVRR